MMTAMRIAIGDYDKRMVMVVLIMVTIHVNMKMMMMETVVMMIFMRKNV